MFLPTSKLNILENNGISSFVGILRYIFRLRINSKHLSSKVEWLNLRSFLVKHKKGSRGYLITNSMVFASARVLLQVMPTIETWWWELAEKKFKCGASNSTHDNGSFSSCSSFFCVVFADETRDSFFIICVVAYQFSWIFVEVSFFFCFRALLCHRVRESLNSFNQQFQQNSRQRRISML